MDTENKVYQQNFTVGKLLIFVLPTVIAMLLASLYSIVDGIFVSNVGGTDAFAAVNQVSPLFMIVASIGFMFGTGGTALISKIQGEGDYDKARKVFSLLTITLIIIAIVASVILWFLFYPLLDLLGATKEMMPFCEGYSSILIPCLPLFMLQYYFQSILTCAGKPQLGLIFTVCAGITNTVGDAILVGVVAQGDPMKAVQGAALATGAGLVIGGLLPLIYFIKKNKSTLRLGRPIKEFGFVGKACGNGISEFLTNVSASVVNAVYNSIFLWMIGAKGVSAYGTVSYVNTIFCAIMGGFTLGVAPIIAYNFGAKNKERLKNLYRKSMLIVILISIIATVVIELLANPLGSIFSHGDEELLWITVSGLHIFTISFLVKGIPTFGSGFFTALNNGFVSGLIATLRTLVFSLAAVIAVPVIFVLIYGTTEAGYYGVWFSVVWAEIGATIMTLALLRKNKKKYGY